MSLASGLNNLTGALPRFRAAWALTSALLVTFAASATAEPKTLTKRWSDVIGFICQSSPALGSDGTIYLGAGNGDFDAYRPDGSRKWVFHTEREIKSSPAIATDGTIYFGSRARKLYALTPDGKKKWEFKTGAWVDSSPALAEDGTVYFGSWDKNFYALNAGGAERWRFTTGGEIVSSPAIGANGTIYFGSHDQKFYALSPVGAKTWEFCTGGPIISSPAIDQDGTIYLTSVDGSFYALDPVGSEKWKLKTGGVSESSPVIGQDGTIYVGVNNELWAMSPKGTKKWAQPYGTELVEAAPLALYDNTVCFASRMGMLLNLSGPGQFNWRFNQNGWGSASAAVSSDGRIYTIENIVGTGLLLCALESEVSLAQSGWPKFRADAQGTGRWKPQGH